MDTGMPWTCAACGAGNAGYRKRCIACGEKKAADAEALVEPEEPVGKVEAGDIPLPLLARKPKRGLGRVPSLVLGAAVLGLAAYGAATYFGSDRPSAADDRAAVEAAVPELFDGAVLVAEVGGPPTDLVDVEAEPGCLDVAMDLARVLDAHATVSLEVVGGPGDVAIHVFDTRPAAIDFDDALRAAAEDGCASPIEERRYVVTGRARMEVRGDDPDEADALLAQFVERLEIEG